MGPCVARALANEPTPSLFNCLFGLRQCQSVVAKQCPSFGEDVWKDYREIAFTNNPLVHVGKVFQPVYLPVLDVDGPFKLSHIAGLLRGAGLRMVIDAK